MKASSGTIDEGTRARSRLITIGLALGTVPGFLLVAIANGGGYQYGVSDQAFYIPAVLRHLDPALFPRDAALLHAQERLTMFGELLAWASRSAGVSLPSLFFACYLAGLAVLLAALVGLGRTASRSRWTVAAFAMAMTLRHRIAQTGVNTLEGYFHPRLLAYAIGLTAIVAFLRGRTGLALLLVAATAFLHPTTAVWFGLLIGVAGIVSDRRWRGPVIGCAAVAGVVAGWALVAGPMRPALAVMDAEWLAALAQKDYLFPGRDWPLWAWAVNFAYPALIVLLYRARRRAGVAVEREAGLVAGSLALFAAFLLSLPLIAGRVALAVQLQVPRVFLILELVTAAYLVWFLAEGAGWARRASGAPRAAVVTFTALAALAAGRGAYTMLHDHPERRLIEVGLAPGAWRDANQWLRTTPKTTHVLADPGHAWRYGTSVRVAAERDVLLEEQKDSAVAMYSRDVARRVVARSRALEGLNEFSTGRLRALAAEYELDFLVTERAIDLPLAYRNERFSVYRLR
jgi:hypothetical protein